jgi:predicted nucleic acid-binding protein
VLVDTSVWIDHFRNANVVLASRLEREGVWCHPFVIGELACGNLARRDEVLTLLAALPQVPEARHSEVMVLVSARRLMGRGIGWVDLHLLTSALMASQPLWTFDKRLASVAEELGIGVRV